MFWQIILFLALLIPMTVAALGYPGLISNRGGGGNTTGGSLDPMIAGPGPNPSVGDDPIPAAPADVALGMPQDLLRRRPDVRSAERRLAAQSAQIGVAITDLYPAFSIGGAIGTTAEGHVATSIDPAGADHCLCRARPS